ncbi:helix-turn-helix domain-containing protein [Priestia endophytica]|uniref:helix-turn-helix domain-containing protein n=1 Tax=Priestia endophytica TaxID=135735 RepID=UPI00203B0E7A|nr:helix-turn-helix transcriptional regulator [Priestia endophytica]MCM3538455.1 helix-turn-helix domain-containing protein [Priestia endophytica]
MLSERLVCLRKDKKLRQEDLAKKFGIARTTYAMYEQGKRQPDYETIIKIADFYKVSVDYLIGRTENPDFNNASVRFDELHFHDMNKLSKEEIEDVKKQALERIEYHLWKKERQGNKHNE